jgi:pepF/M3 family oligoendopeptidase
MPAQTPPRWDLTNVYPSLQSPEFAAAIQTLQEKIKSSEILMARAESLDLSAYPSVLADMVNSLVDGYNDIMLLTNTIDAYLYSFNSTDSFNTEANRKMSEFEMQTVAVRKINTRLRSWIGKIANTLPAVTAKPGAAREHAFQLNEAARLSRYLMSQSEEALAAELSLSGANAWSKLQSTVVSQTSVEFELDGKLEKMPMPAIINLRNHPDESVRRRAYETEIKTWETVREPLAACMNGIKGSVNTLNKHRKREDSLHSALDANRIDRQTLEALLTAMRESLPMYRRYFQAKARILGKEKLAWWDLFAPVGKTDRTYTYDQAREIVLDNFSLFSSDLAGMARRAFEKNWIDAEMRSGKVGGAFCMALPAVKESRVMLNFDGSFDTVSTMAHELGHAFHNECMFKVNRTEWQRVDPMTLAETASIMCETIVTDALRSRTESPAEEIGLLEATLNNDSQVVVDIYSRYLFEKEVFERREKAELSADELCEIMEKCQKEAYGDGLDERYLHKYMWTWKPHYYYEGLSFYNFPYAFGLLFGIGLYAIYQQRGAAFIPDYMDLLASTGMDNASELADRFGIDIRTPDFWRGSLGVINQRIDRYIELSKSL